MDGKTVGDIMKTFTKEQLDVVYFLIGYAKLGEETLKEIEEQTNKETATANKK